MPPWALAELPGQHRAIVKRIQELEEEERRLRRMVGLLFETGEPLNKLVRDAIREIGFPAELTRAGATYDVTATPANTPGRLLIEVTGIEGQINKGSKKIAQVLDAQQKEARAGDRVCVAVNAYRDRPPVDRDKLEPLTADALALLVGLNAAVVTTTDLFHLWKLSKADRAAAQEGLLRLFTALPGVVKLT